MRNSSDLSAGAFSRPLCWLIGIAGIIVLSPDALLLRLVNSDTNAVVSLRALFSSVTLLVVIAFIPLLRRGFRWKPIILYSIFYALGLATFPLSILNTHVANTLVIIAVAPMLAAIGAFVVLGEKTKPATCIAAAVIVVGMAAIFADTLGGGNLLGDVLAFFTAVALAGMSIVVRRYPDTAVYPGLVVGGFVIALVFGIPSNWDNISGRDVALLAVDGAIVMSLSFLLIITAARGLPPAEVNLIFLLETVLGPFWVWLFLHEIPPFNTVSVGILIVTVLMLHAAWMLKSARQSAAGS